MNKKIFWEGTTKVLYTQFGILHVELSRKGMLIPSFFLHILKRFLNRVF